MEITISNMKKPSTITQSAKTRNKELADRGNLPSMWGVVIETFSDDNSADVELRNGLLLRRVTVPSRKWVGSNATTPFGSQDLPPKDTEVLIIFPDNLIEEAVIIATRFEILGDAGIEQKKEFLKSGQERIITDITEYGWKSIYNKDTGVVQLQHPTETNFLIKIDEANKKITIQDWNLNNVIMDVDGIVVEDKNSNKTIMKSTGILTQDTNGNTLEWVGSVLKLNGDTKDFVTHTELNTALQIFITALNANFAAKLDGGGTTGVLALDISSAKALKVKTG